MSELSERQVQGDFWRLKWEAALPSTTTQTSSSRYTTTANLRRHSNYALTQISGIQIPNQYLGYCRMRLINHDRQRRVLMLVKRLDELAAARPELLLQLETVDAQAGAVQLECNALRNMDAPISILPDEVLAMIFEAGMHPQDSRPHNASFDFGVLVSHVIQRWRNISIATPRLWTSIWCISHRGYPPYPEGRVATFLSRARSLPLDIDIIGFYDKDFSPNFLQLLSDHMGHCRHLRMNAKSSGLTKALKCISLQPMPLLELIDLECQDDALEFHELVFRSGVPRLTTARIVDIDFTTMHHCLPAFSSLMSLQLVCIDYPDYSSFRNGLMALPSLRHLELYGNQERSAPKSAERWPGPQKLWSQQDQVAMNLLYAHDHPSSCV